VVYAPTSGTVAPYNTATTQFQEFVESGTTTGLNYGDLADYKGFMPAGVQIDNSVPTDSAWSTDGKGVYTYESTYGNGTAVLIRGTYNNASEACYYKVELATQSENYNILRNICYTITIDEVLGEGYASAKEAMENTAGNNLSGSVDTENLLNISDGQSRLFVEYVDKRIMNTNSFTLKYKYEPVLNGASANAFKTESNTGAHLTGVLNAKVGDTETKFITGWSVTKTDAGEGWSEITFTVNADVFNDLDDNEVLQGSFVISSNALSRTVRLYMLKPYTMTVSCNPMTVARSVGASVTINTHIPIGLPSDIFPLVFDIEAAELSIYPDPNFKNDLGQAVTMPVKTGNTIIPNTTKNSFYFQRTLTEAEYNALDTDDNGYKVMPSGFLTNKAASASDVWVYNEFFGEAKNTHFGNTKASKTNNITVAFDNQATYYGADREVEATIIVPEAAGVAVNVTLGNGFKLAETSDYTTNNEGKLVLKLKTTTWSSDRSVEVSYTGTVETDEYNITYNDGSDTATVNKLHIPAGNIKWPSVGRYSNYSVYLYKGTSRVGGNNSPSLGNVNGNNTTISNGAVTITVSGLGQNDELRLGYSTSYVSTTYSENTFTANNVITGNVTVSGWN